MLLPMFVEGTFASGLPVMGKGFCCDRGDDPIVRAINQIVQIAGRNGPEYG
jgi:hypothetical protein